MPSSATGTPGAWNGSARPPFASWSSPSPAAIQNTPRPPFTRSRGGEETTPSRRLSQRRPVPAAGVTEDARVGLFQALREMVPDVPADPIAHWLASDRNGGPQSRAQAVRILAALHDRAVLAAGPILPALLADPAADVRKAALALARDVRTEKARDALIALVRSDARPAEERGLALAALRG